jgi:hypothetical protein
MIFNERDQWEFQISLAFDLQFLSIFINFALVQSLMKFDESFCPFTIVISCQLLLTLVQLLISFDRGMWVDKTSYIACKLSLLHCHQLSSSLEKWKDFGSNYTQQSWILAFSVCPSVTAACTHRPAVLCTQVRCSNCPCQVSAAMKLKFRKKPKLGLTLQ